MARDAESPIRDVLRVEAIAPRVARFAGLALVPDESEGLAEEDLAR